MGLNRGKFANKRYISKCFKLIKPSVNPIEPEESEVILQEIIDGKLVINGAYSLYETDKALYLDCAPEVDWIYPVQNNTTLTIEQAYSTVLSGETTIEVK